MSEELELSKTDSLLWSLWIKFREFIRLAFSLNIKMREKLFLPYLFSSALGFIKTSRYLNLNVVPSFNMFKQHW